MPNRLIRVSPAFSFPLALLCSACDGAVPALRAEPLPAPGPTRAAMPSVVILSDQARRFLALLSRALPTEFLGCMIGDVRGDTVLVQRIGPADVDPAQSAATWVVPSHTCEAAGWTPTVGMIHSHPTAMACWYFFPGTTVPTSDGRSFVQTAYPVDAIMCADHVVWVSRAMVQQQITLKVGSGE